MSGRAFVHVNPSGKRREGAREGETDVGRVCVFYETQREG